MNIGALGIVAGTVVQGMQARVSEADRVQQENTTTDRELKSADLAEQAEGVGVTHEEEATGERDADGRMQWQLNEPQPPLETDVPAETIAEDEPPHHAKDPTGQAGNLLDLDG